MNTYTLESFINFCDDMQIAEEKGLLGKIGSRASNNVYKKANGSISIGNKKIMAKVDIKLNNNDIEIPENKLPISLPTIMEAVDAVQKEFPKILDSIANDMYEYADYTSDLAHSISRYRRAQDLKKDLIPQGPFEYEYDEKYKIGMFSLTYDTTPYPDPNHVYTKFVKYNFNTRKVTYEGYIYTMPDIIN